MDVFHLTRTCLNEEARQNENHQNIPFLSREIILHYLLSLQMFRIRTDSPYGNEIEKWKMKSYQYSKSYLTEKGGLPNWLASELGLSALLSEKCFSLSYPEVL